MALPLSRNTTYAAGSQVKSLDLNAIQDAIIALAAARSIAFPMKPYCTNDAAGTITFANDLGSAVFSAASVIGKFTFPLNAGQTLTGFKFSALGNTTADIDVEYDIIRASGGTMLIAAPVSFTNLPATAAFYTSTLTTPYVVQEGDMLWFGPSPNATGITIQQLLVLYKP